LIAAEFTTYSQLCKNNLLATCITIEILLKTADMSNEGLFWPLEPSCKQDKYVPKKDIERDTPKGVPRFTTSKGIPWTPRFLNEGQKFVEKTKIETKWEMEREKKRIQAATFVTKPTPKNACPGDKNGLFSTSAYIYDGKPFDWAPRCRVTPATPKQVLASAPAKAGDVQVQYIPEDYDGPKKMEKV
jgi:hypothetical protein